MTNTNPENDSDITDTQGTVEQDIITPQVINDAEPHAEVNESETVNAEPVSIDIQINEDEPQEAAPEERILVLEAQVADLNDKYLRTVAEMENVRRRTQVEKENASKFAIASFAREMLTVSDNMTRAFTSVEGEGKGENADASEIATQFKGFIEGVKMTEDGLMKTLDKLGLQKIKPLGLRFDANFHEALFEFEDKNQPEGTVSQVLEQGFTLNGRLLRPAKVGITKGGPKPFVTTKKVPTEDDGAPKDGPSAYEKKGAGTGSQLNEET